MQWEAGITDFKRLWDEACSSVPQMETVKVRIAGVGANVNTDDVIGLVGGSDYRLAHNQLWGSSWVNAPAPCRYELESSEVVSLSDAALGKRVLLEIVPAPPSDGVYKSGDYFGDVNMVFSAVPPGALI
jgi:hypothetical protein